MTDLIKTGGKDLSPITPGHLKIGFLYFIGVMIYYAEVTAKYYLFKCIGLSFMHKLLFCLAGIWPLSLSVLHTEKSACYNFWLLRYNII